MTPLSFDSYETVPCLSAINTPPRRQDTSPRRVALIADIVRTQSGPLPTEIAEASKALFMATMAFYCKYTELSMAPDLRATLDAMSLHPTSDQRNTLTIAVNLVQRGPASLDSEVTQALTWAHLALKHAAWEAL